MEERIKSLLNNNPQKAYALMVDEYSERLYWHIRGIVLNHDDANDVVQNVFIQIYKNLPKFKWESKLYTWMYRIATNESLNHLRKIAKHKNISYEDVSFQIAKNLEADVYFDGDESQLILQEAIAKLPEKQRLVFQMKYFEGMKYDEISEVLETSAGALKASYHHASKKIEEYVKQKVNF